MIVVLRVGPWFPICGCHLKFVNRVLHGQTLRNNGIHHDLQVTMEATCYCGHQAQSVDRGVLKIDLTEKICKCFNPISGIIIIISQIMRFNMHTIIFDGADTILITRYPSDLSLSCMTQYVSSSRAK